MDDITMDNNDDKIVKKGEKERKEAHINKTALK